ncbi:hypothetical protein K470DRAFT_276040 [Piedraia hortae CBS 480.64]|uniref:Uncharacterized protein n=1 Tax=Piedraia hortae CBS 480.64 TaxID=1314780 RepID=A0A6A7C2D6_9PEZI|nr:hypothetical protein K470DRAFT_276040 [Piedraia hortae CBS 480.64]
MAMKTYCAYALECFMAYLTGNATQLSLASVSQLWDKYNDYMYLTSPLEVPTGAMLFIWYVNSTNPHIRDVKATIQTTVLDCAIKTVALRSINPYICTLDQLQGLEVKMMLLHNFTRASRNPMAWEFGLQGIRVTLDFPSTQRGWKTYKGYSPYEIRELGFVDKPSVVATLVRCLLGSAASLNWVEDWERYKGEIVAFEGEAVGMSYCNWVAWKEWAVMQPEARRHEAYENAREGIFY